MAEKGIVGVCGSGHIGRGWAMLFASAGYQVNLFDLKKSQVECALEDIEAQLVRLDADGMLRGGRAVAGHLALIKGVTTLEDCVKGAIHIQECIPERLQMKKDLFTQLDQLASPTAILASSTSSIAPSLFSEDLKNRSNCLVNHPINPPYIIRLIEIVPAPWTSTTAVARTRAFMAELGQAPVTFAREILGFGVNRIQLAIMNECWHLVNEGILTAPDVDLLMKEGLGARYAWQGPLEVAHLLADGIGTAIQHFGPSFMEMGKTFLPHPTWSLEDSKEIVDQMNRQVPPEQIESRRKWRDERLIAFAKLKNKMSQKDANQE